MQKCSVNIIRFSFAGSPVFMPNRPDWQFFCRTDAHWCHPTFLSVYLDRNYDYWQFIIKQLKGCNKMSPKCFWWHPSKSQYIFTKVLWTLVFFLFHLTFYAILLYLMSSISFHMKRQRSFQAFQFFSKLPTQFLPFLFFEIFLTNIIYHRMMGQN